MHKSSGIFEVKKESGFQTVSGHRLNIPINHMNQTISSLNIVFTDR